MVMYDIASVLENQLIVPMLSEAFRIISIIGGLTLWLVVLSVFIKALESKLGPTGWTRAAALWDLFSNFKWLIVSIIGLYVTIYVLAFTINYVNGGTVVNPESFAGELLYKLFFGPFIEMWSGISHG